MNIMSWIFTVTYYGFIGLAAVVSLRALWMALTLPRRGVREPSCETCHYPAKGLKDFHCPECGTDLRLGGIVTPQMEVRRRAGPVMTLMAAAACWAGLSYGALWLFWQFGLTNQMVTSWQQSTRREVTYLLSTNDGALRDASIHVVTVTHEDEAPEVDWWFSGEGPDHKNIGAWFWNAQGVLCFRSDGGSWTASPPAGRPDVFRLLSEAGLENGVAAELADELVAMFAAAQKGIDSPFPATNRIKVESGETLSNPYTSSRPSKKYVWYVIAVGCGWLVLGAIGACLLHRRRGKLLRTAQRSSIAESPSNAT